MPRLPSNGDFAYTANGTSVFVPDLMIESHDDKQSYRAVVLRGSPYSVAVYDEKTAKFVGWTDIKDLGFRSVRQFMESGAYKPIAKFDAPLDIKPQSTPREFCGRCFRKTCHGCGGYSEA